MKWSVVLVALLLAGCATTKTIVAPPDRPRLDEPSTDLTKGCSWPQMVKAAEMTQEQVETLLRGNARAQIDCVKRHKLLVDFYRKRDAALRKGGGK